MPFRSRITIMLAVEGALLILLALGLALLPNSPLARGTRELLRNFDPNTVTTVEISNDTAPGGITLQRTGGEAAPPTTTAPATDDTTTAAAAAAEQDWNFILEDTPVPAEGQKIATLLEEVTEARRIRNVTNNAARYAELGLAEDAPSARNRLTLRNSAGEVIADFAIGIENTQGNLYVQEVENATVYEVASGLNFYIDQTPGYWQDTALLPPDITLDDVSRYTLVADIFTNTATETVTDNYTLVRQPGDADTGGGASWESMPAPAAPLDDTKINNVVASALRLAAAEFTLIDPASPELSNYREAASVTLQLTDQRNYTLRIFELDGGESGDLYIFPNGDGVQLSSIGIPYIYRIFDWALQPILQSLDTLYVPAEDPAAAAQ